MKRLIPLLLLFFASNSFGFTPTGNYWLSNPTVYINNAGTPDCTNEFSAIQNTLDTWNAVSTSYFHATNGGTTSRSPGVYDNYNVLGWIENNWPYSSSAIAVTLSWSINGQNQDVDILFNGVNFVWSDAGESGKMDIQNITTHEFGHFVGLADLYNGGDAEKTMYGYSVAGETKKRTLELDDADGERYVYLDPTTSGSLTEDQRWLPWRGGSTITLVGNVTIPSGRRLDLEPGLTINLSSYSLSTTGGSLSDNGASSWLPFNVIIKSGSTLLGHYSSLALAISAATSGQTVTVNGGNHTLEYEPEVHSGVTLILNNTTLTLVDGAFLWLYSNSALQLNNSTLNVGYGELAIPYAGVTIQANSSTITANNYITIPSGSSLQATNSTFRFGSGAKLRIQGTLTTSGANTFTSTGGQWYGIEFYNAPNGSYINESTIQNAQYGVFCRNTSLSLMNCHFVSCNTGVYTNTIFGTMGLQGNLFSGLGIGVDCANYASPAIEPSNTLRYNDYAVRSDATSQPMLGDPQGANSIHDNGWDVWSDYPGTIWARGNWWGSYPAMPFIRGTVDYSYELQFDPSNEKINLQTPPPASVAESSAASPEDTLGLSAYEALHGKFLKGETSMLEGELEGVISQYSNKLSGRMALALLLGLKEKQGADLSSTLASAVSSYPGTAVGKTASLFKVGALVKAGRNQEAFDLAKTLVDQGDVLTLKEALYDAGSIAWYSLEKKAEGESYFRQLAEKYPGDPLTASGLATLGETPVVKGTAKAEVAPPQDFALLPAYPNPFNPQTVLRYALPDGAKVSLKVYDLLGREVATLVNERKEAGVHEVTFDAAVLASGVYFYRLEAGTHAETKKLVLLR